MSMSAQDSEKVDNWFTFHPASTEQAQKYEAIRESAREFARVICLLCPGSADRTAALRKVREAVMTANASIACNGK